MFVSTVSQIMYFRRNRCSNGTAFGPKSLFSKWATATWKTLKWVSFTSGCITYLSAVRHCHLNFFHGRSDNDIGSSSLCWRFFWASDGSFRRSQVCFTEKANQLFLYVCLESGLFKNMTYIATGEKCCNIELRIIPKFLLTRLWPLRRKGPNLHALYLLDCSFITALPLLSSV